MLTKEQIEARYEGAKARFNETNVLEEANCHVETMKLCRLALVGLAVQWRPIEEAPPAQAECQVLVKHKNGEISLRYSDGDFWRYALSKQPDFYIKSFIPLSALPTPGGQS